MGSERNPGGRREDLRDRTFWFAVAIARFVSTRPLDGAHRVIGHQLLRSGTAVGANYRAACRAKSDADLLNKLKIVEEEADESSYWLELLCELRGEDDAEIERLTREADEITSMVVAGIKTLRQRERDRSN